MSVENKKAANEASGIQFKTTFTDPGFYVNTWDAIVNLKVKSEEAVFKLTMLANEIDTYKVEKEAAEVTTVRIKIPIPPEYGKEVVLKAITLKGELEFESIKVIPPGNEKPYSIYPEK